MFLLVLMIGLLGGQAADDRGEAVRLARAGEHAEALERFRRITSSNPEDIGARVWVGRLHTWMGREEEAEGVFRSVLASSPDNIEALIGLGAVLVAQGQYDNAAAVLARAEGLAPENPEVLAAQGRLHRLAGRTTLALAYYRKATLLDPANGEIRRGFELTRLAHSHRIEARGLHEDFSRPIDDTRGGEVTLNLRLSDGLRVFARGQRQRKFRLTENRGGGGVELRLHRSTWLRGHVLVGSNVEVLPELDVNSDVDYIRGRLEIIGGLRYIRFSSADVWIAAPGLTWWFGERVAVSARYYRSFTSFASRSDDVANDSGLVRLRLRVHPRLWLDAGYARGNESFETLSLDQLGDFQADTAIGGLRLDLPTLTSLVAAYEFQWRSDGSKLRRVTTALVQRF